MQARVSKWGNSLAIRLPKAAAASLRVKEGEAIELTIEDDAVVLRAARPRFSIEELVSQMGPGTEPESLDDLSQPVGEELL